MAALATLPACNPAYDNPFAGTGLTAAPPAASDLIFTGNNFGPRSGLPRELFAIKQDGSGLTRLTFCNNETQSCDTLEASSAPDRQRVVARRVLQDSNGDGQLTINDGESLVFIDLARSTQAVLVPATRRVSGLDWSPTGSVLVYSALGEGGQEDLWRMDPNGANNRNLTSSPSIRERRPRIDPAGSVAVYERIDAAGKGQVYIFSSSVQQIPVTTGGPGSEPLPGSPYVVGSDADPDFSPDGRSVAFRRLTALGNEGLGIWDVLTVANDGSGLSVVASGPLYRGAPDWGPQGIVFTEIDAGSGVSRIVVIQPSGSSPRILFAQTGGVSLSYPRWLP